MIREYGKRIGLIVLGQTFSAIGIAMLLQANIGTDPWNVLHQGISRTAGISFGAATVVVGAVVIALALLMGERIGLGTIIGTVFAGPLTDKILSLGIISQMTTLPTGILMLLGGLELLTLGTWLYLSQYMGAGPRDSLNVALSKKTRLPVGACRSAIELIATLAGWCMGGTVGVGTLLSAFCVGMLFQANFRLLRFDATGVCQENLAQTFRRIRDRAQQPDETDNCS